MKKRICISFIFIIGILLIVGFNKSFAATVTKTYNVTDQITATLDTEGTLTISGTGEIPDYNTSAPWRNDNVKKVIINSGITKIGKNAFANCSDMASVSLNEGLIQIESYAFQNTRLKTVQIPSTLKKIGVDAFLNVTTIESFSVKGGNNETFYTDKGVLYNHLYDLTNNKYYDQRALVAYPTANTMTNYSILSGTTDIAQSAFKNALNLKQVTIPDSIESIGANSFINTGLTSITIPKVTLTTFGPDAFENNKYLKTVDFKADLKIWAFSDAKYLQGGMFRNCTALERITFSGDIEEFGANVFYGCTSLNQITLPSTLKEIGLYIVFKIVQV